MTVKGRVERTFSTIINDTSGSILLGRTLCRAYESLRRATRVVGVSFVTSIPGSKSTTYLPSGCTLTRIFVFPIGLTTSPTYDPGSCNSCSSSRRSRTGKRSTRLGRDEHVSTSQRPVTLSVQLVPLRFKTPQVFDLLSDHNLD